MGQVIDFRTRQIIPTAPVKPAFSAWLTERVGGHWTVVKVRNYRRGWRGLPWPNGHVLLLNREYDALEAEYESLYGPRYA